MDRYTQKKNTNRGTDIDLYRHKHYDIYEYGWTDTQRMTKIERQKKKRKQ